MTPQGDPSMVKIIHYLVLGVLALGAVYYVWTKPPTINPMLDRRGADALAMVQTHRALGYPTILQAMTEHVRSMKERGLNARLGEWRVKQVDGDLYEVRVQLRDRGASGQWFEREFIWHANLSLKRVNAASLPADGITPKPAETDEPTHQAHRNQIFLVLPKILFEVWRQRDLYVLILHTDRAAGDREIRIAVTLAGADVELPSVPWTGDDLAGERAFADRSSCVRTGIVDRKKRTVHVEQRDPHSVDVDGLAGTRRNLFDFRHRDKLRHAASWIVMRRGDPVLRRMAPELDFDQILWHRR